MTPDKYYTFYFSEDGDVSVNIFTKEQLEKKINDKDWGNVPIFKSTPDQKYIDAETLNCLMIIKGTEVQPQPVTEVTQYKLP